MIRRSLAMCLPILIFMFAVVALTFAQTPTAPTEALEILALKRQLTQTLKQIADLQATVGACQGQLGTYHLRQNTEALAADEKAMVEKFEKANPGFTLDVQSGTVTKKAPPEKPKL